MNLAAISEDNQKMLAELTGILTRTKNCLVGPEPTGGPDKMPGTSSLLEASQRIAGDLRHAIALANAIHSELVAPPRELNSR